MPRPLNHRTPPLRYIVYSKVMSLDEFWPIHPVPKFARPDLNNDMTVGLVLVHEGDISAEHRLYAVINTATFTSVLSLAQQRMDTAVTAELIAEGERAVHSGAMYLTSTARLTGRRRTCWPLRRHYARSERTE